MSKKQIINASERDKGQKNPRNKLTMKGMASELQNDFSPAELNKDL